MITNLHKNIMGTVSFDGLFPGMRKPQGFTVYPVKSPDEAEIEIQSDTRFGAISLTDGKVFMSKSHSSGAYGYHLALEGRRLSLCKLSPEDLLILKAHLFASASGEAGRKENGIVQCDNSGAAGVFDHHAPGAV